MFVPEDPTAWPLDGAMIVFNMTVDCFSMVPQMFLVAESDWTAVAVESHFLGLLTAARGLRMAYWSYTLLQDLWLNGGGRFIFIFLLPDLLHTFLMKDYLCLWVSKMGRGVAEFKLPVGV